MRVVLTVKQDHYKHTDRLDLYLAKSRKIFANQLAKDLSLEATEIEKDLLLILEELERLEHEALEKRKAQDSDQPFCMTEGERQEALAFLKQPDFLNQIVHDLDICGYVGVPNRIHYRFSFLDSFRDSQHGSFVWSERIH